MISAHKYLEQVRQAQTEDELQPLYQKVAFSKILADKMPTDDSNAIFRAQMIAVAFADCQSRDRSFSR